MLFSGVAYAMGGTGGAGGSAQGLAGFLPLIAMFAIFYFLLIRPQQKRAKEHKAMLNALKRGDEVVTQGGIHGRVTGITEDVVNLEIAPEVKIRVQRSAISAIKKS
ncbi:MAG: preprotein translocase subunit YajC [Deltaproteobacteria bacterium]|nr:preprotein translocase subunit YajC [Deltaproteobacteria bacterium]